MNSCLIHVCPCMYNANDCDLFQRPNPDNLKSGKDLKNVQKSMHSIVKIYRQRYA